MSSPSTLLSLIACLLLLGCGGSDPSTPASKADATGFTKDGTLTFVRPDGSEITTIDVEIADTDAKRRRGLMARRSMGYDRGMLFLFDEASTGGMWMKNTPMPLDILFVAPDSSIVTIAERTRPFSTDPIEPTSPRKYVVEVRAGFADRFDVTEGTRIRWTRQTSTDPASAQ